jgi:putative phosphoribosyl transferase
MFRDRTDAGKQLAGKLDSYRETDAVVLGLPRGGVIVGRTVADVLHLLLDVYVVRKLRAPGNPEFAIGAVAEDGEPWLERRTIQRLGISPEYVQGEIAYQRAEIERQVRAYRGTCPLVSITDHPVIVVDDGIATGATVLAAVNALRTRQPRELVVAAPVCSPAAARIIESYVDRLVTVLQPEEFWAVGQFYLHFEQVSDADVTRALTAETGAS